MELDADLQAIQEVRDALRTAKEARKRLERMTQEQIDSIVEAMAKAAEREAGRLGKLAVAETGFGNEADKKAKNVFAARDVYESIRTLRTVGIIKKDDARQVWEIAQPVGTVAAIIPSTNPTSTVIFKCLIALKARNAIVISPHPSALGCSHEAAEVMIEAATRAGAPAGSIHCLSRPTLAASQELMTHKLTDMILATGGTAMVKAAYSSGKPAYGVGPGNVPVYIHRSADIRSAVRLILQSKSFDYGTICASEQALVVDRCVKGQLLDELKRQGGYFLNELEKQNIESVLLSGKGLNPRIVGRSPQAIAAMVGISVPSEARVLIAEESGVGAEHPFSMEKLSPLLALYTVEDWREGCARCMELLELGGLGHTIGIHCTDLQVIEAFGLEKPASRIVVNSGTTFGGIGATTGLQPSMTLGCGTFGNNITSDNIGPQHLLNVKRLAFGVREPVTETQLAEPLSERSAGHRAEKTAAGRLGLSREDVMEMVRTILAEMKAETR